MNNQLNTKFYIIISLLGLVFLILIYLFSPRSINPYKFIFVLIFILICLLGMWAAIYPGHCLRMLNIEKLSDYKCSTRKLKYEGHHPNCAEFSKHVFSFRNKKFCAGCTGLLIGGFLAIITCLFYLIYGTSQFILWTGFIITFFSLFQLTLLNIENITIKFFSNLGLVWGSSLILTGLINYSNTFIAIYFLFLVVAWIISRTAVSSENHQSICNDCIEFSN